MAAAAGKKEGGAGGGGEENDVRDKVAAFSHYEAYLDSQITELDLFYLEDEDIARQLIELGYRGSGDVLKRDEFEARKKADREKHLHKEAAPKPLASMSKDLNGKPLLQALAAREELVRHGKLTCIIFVRDVNAKGQEVSGYIDFAQRLKMEDWEPYFDGKKRIIPRPSDLSFYNWDTGTSTSNSTSNFQVIADSDVGMLFKNKRDRKVVNVDPSANPGDNTTRTEIKTDEYAQVVIYDHFTRRKGPVDASLTPNNRPAGSQRYISVAAMDPEEQYAQLARLHEDTLAAWRSSQKHHAAVERATATRIQILTASMEAAKTMAEAHARENEALRSQLLQKAQQVNALRVELAASRLKVVDAFSAAGSAASTSASSSRAGEVGVAHASALAAASCSACPRCRAAAAAAEGATGGLSQAAYDDIVEAVEKLREAYLLGMLPHAGGGRSGSGSPGSPHSGRGYAFPTAEEIADALMRRASK